MRLAILRHHIDWPNNIDAMNSFADFNRVIIKKAHRQIIAVGLALNAFQQRDTRASRPHNGQPHIFGARKFPAGAILPVTKACQQHQQKRKRSSCEGNQRRQLLHRQPDRQQLIA
ncbi:hypothetical protein SDC9_136196 [bioreactor metagenome]|uniref:Uncharacterized protein n=1 Tax=bioreactor metagenome TaxID=1076179 RepID=A0A645DJ76_9ZZZZ